MTRRELKDFHVEVKEVWSRTIRLKLPANATRDQVLAAVNKKIENEGEGTTEYSHTLDQDMWTVRDDYGNYM